MCVVNQTRTHAHTHTHTHAHTRAHMPNPRISEIHCSVTERRSDHAMENQ